MRHVMFIVPISQMPPVSSLQEASKINPASAPAYAEIPFSDVFKDAVGNLQESQKTSAEDALDLALGNSDDLHTVMINSEIAATALELTVQLKSRAVNAYNEIMRMQV
jgi:flagellar hook-basal body complex protein FliE